jgi:two-component system response regulator FixJ
MPAENGFVHIVDDDEAMRDSLGFLLDVEGFSTRLFASAETFLTALDGLEQGCIVTDVRMPGISGIDLVRRVREQGLSNPIIVMTGHGDVALAVEAMKAGAQDFIEKPFSDDVLLRALRSARDAKLPSDGDDTARRDAEARLSLLSPREHDVLLGVVAGKSNKVIAQDLEISPRTVEVYRANLMTKTGVRSVSDLMRLALAAGL